MSRNLLALAVVSLLTLGSSARAAVIFETVSVARQTLTSPLFGSAPVVISATGAQIFTLDLGTGMAGVTSDFQGTDLPDPLNPGSFLNYDLYNIPASTTGTVVLNGAGSYDVSFELLFELMITSGALAGQTFETLAFATFAASNIPSIPFPAGTVFADPTPPDTVAIFAKTSLPGVYNAGDPVGTSSDRTVTILRVVPEPANIVTLGIGALCLAGMSWKRRRVTRDQV
jgi:hypothetical protein